MDQLQFEGLLRESPNDGRPLIGLGEADAVKAAYRGERRISIRRSRDGRPGTGGISECGLSKAHCPRVSIFRDNQSGRGNSRVKCRDVQTRSEYGSVSTVP